MRAVRYNMKTLLALVSVLLFAPGAFAGVDGLLTSDTRDWQFVEDTGGMRIGVPVQKGGKKMLPIEYDASGQTTVTRKPVTMNSGLAVRKIETELKDGNIIIRVITQVVEKTSNTGSKHFADLSGIPRGSYEVYYETAGDPKKHLGQIEVK